MGVEMDSAENQQKVEAEEAKLIESDNSESSSAIGFLEAWKLPGVAPFAFCLFFSKLVAYTFLYWLPFYIRHTGNHYYYITWKIMIYIELHCLLSNISMLFICEEFITSVFIFLIYCLKVLSLGIWSACLVGLLCDVSLGRYEFVWQVLHGVLLACMVQFESGEIIVYFSKALSKNKTKITHYRNCHDINITWLVQFILEK